MFFSHVPPDCMMFTHFKCLRVLCFPTTIMAKIFETLGNSPKFSQFPYISAHDCSNNIIVTPSPDDDIEYAKGQDLHIFQILVYGSYRHDVPEY